MATQVAAAQSANAGTHHSRSNSAAKPGETFPALLTKVVDQLTGDASTITPEEARVLQENFPKGATDECTARLISAVESVAAAQQDIKVHKAKVSAGARDVSPLLLGLRNVLLAVEIDPQHVTQDTLKLAQTIVTAMRKTIGQSNTPHPELEAELQKEFAKIEPKVEQGTVTREEADHLHSLEARAHGHTEKGGLTAIAQSVAAKREKSMSISSGSSAGNGASHDEQSQNDKEHNSKQAVLTIRTKAENDYIAKDDAALLQNREAHAHSHIEKDGIAAQVQSKADKETNLEADTDRINDKIDHDPKTVTEDDAALLHNREERAHGHTEKGGITAQAQSLADRYQ